MVYGIVLAHTPSVQDAEDAFQEVFLTYHRKQPEFNSEEHRKAWLIRTALNCARRLASSSWRLRTVLTDDLSNNQAESPDFAFTTDLQDQVFRALKQLPDAYRSAIYLFYFEDYSVAQIAAALEIRAEAVKQRLSRGRKLMRQQVEGGLFDE
jgi:RNA polymerase sigma-70 factor (ECF subfamily)